MTIPLGLCGIRFLVFVGNLLQGYYGDSLTEYDGKMLTDGFLRCVVLDLVF